MANDWDEIYLTYPQKLKDVWPDMADNSGIACINAFAQWLDVLEITIPNAFIYFMLDYGEQKTLYKRVYLEMIAERVAESNAKKYNDLLAIYTADYNPFENYDRVEDTTHTRTPDITREQSGESSRDSTTETDVKQAQTTTTKQGQIETETEISPFDAAAYKPQQKQTIRPAAGTAGQTTTETTFSGDPDTTTTAETTTGSTTQTETGTETTTIESRIHGNIGTVTAQKMAEETYQLAAKMNIWNIIKKDLAAAICLGVWE